MKGRTKPQPAITKWALYLLGWFVLLSLGTAQADTIVFTGTVGDYGASTTTIGGITVTAYYRVNGTWQPASLFGRNEPNDHGLGVCNPVESSNCGTGSGKGDINELDNNGPAELIRLTLPAGYQWVSVQLSSLDNNGTTSSNKWERGILWGDTDGTAGVPYTPAPTGSVGDGVYCTFAAGGMGGSGAEPIFSLAAFGHSPYLFFQPIDWTGGGNFNNDFLVMAVTIEHVPEPGSMLLLGTGLVGALGAWRRRSRA